METLTDLFDAIQVALGYQLFQLGENPVTIGTILSIIVFTGGVIFLSGRMGRWSARTLEAAGVELGARHAVATIIRYLVLVIGLVVIVQSTGIDLSAFTVAIGALGVGIGFGLQNVISNFVSGLIILFERPIKVGDRVDVGSVHGDVVKISARATTVVTNNNIAIIVPNSDFISTKVTNWSYIDRNVRFDVPVGVSYSSDPELVTKILLGVAAEHPAVLERPEPLVLFEEFGDSSLNFTLLVWTSALSTRPRILRSELNYAIAREFKDQGVEIPFPQRDLHIRSGLPSQIFPKRS